MAQAITYHAEKCANCNGVKLCFDSFGDPKHPAIILIMGLATQLVHWDRLFCEQLAANGFWVIRFDNRDIGKSSKLNHLHTPCALR